MSAQSPVSASQLRHWYACEMVGVPDQLPGSAVSVRPLCVSPVTVGGEVLAGGAATTTSLASDSAVAAAPGPAALVAVASTRRRRPTSADVIWKVAASAPGMSAQSVSSWASQLRHWYSYASGGVPVQLPGAAVTVSASRRVPDIVGTAVLAGGSAATAPVAAD